MVKHCGIKGNHHCVIIYVLINKDPDWQCNNSKHFPCYCPHVKPEFHEVSASFPMKRFFVADIFFEKEF